MIPTATLLASTILHLQRAIRFQPISPAGAAELLDAGLVDIEGGYLVATAAGRAAATGLEWAQPAPHPAKQTLRTRIADAEARACRRDATPEDRAAAQTLHNVLRRGGK